MIMSKTISVSQIKEAAKDFLNWLFQSDEGKDMVVHKMMSVPAFSASEAPLYTL